MALVRVPPPVVDGPLVSANADGRERQNSRVDRSNIRLGEPERERIESDTLRILINDEPVKSIPDIQNRSGTEFVNVIDGSAVLLPRGEDAGRSGAEPVAGVRCKAVVHIVAAEHAVMRAEVVIQPGDIAVILADFNVV